MQKWNPPGAEGASSELSNITDCTIFEPVRQPFTKRNFGFLNRGRLSWAVNEVTAPQVPRNKFTRCTVTANKTAKASSIMKRHGARRIRPGWEARAPNQPKTTDNVRQETTKTKVVGRFMMRRL